MSEPVASNSVQRPLELEVVRANSADIHTAEAGQPIDPAASTHQPNVRPWRNAPFDVAKKVLQQFNIVAATRPDPQGIFDEHETLNEINDHLGHMSHLLIELEEHGLAAPASVLRRDTDAASSHKRDFTAAKPHPGWRFALLAGRVLISGLQLARPSVEGQRKAVAMFIPHQFLSFMFAAGLHFRNTSGGAVVLDHFARRDVFLGTQALGTVWGLISKDAKHIVDHTGFKAAVTFMSVLLASAAIFPHETERLFNRIFKGHWQPKLAGVELTPETRPLIEEFNQRAREGRQAVRRMRESFEAAPTGSTDLVLTRLERNFTDAEGNSATLLQTVPEPPANTDFTKKLIMAGVSGAVAASPLPFLGGNDLARMGVAANLALTLVNQLMTAVDPTRTSAQSWDNFTKFCAVTLFMGPIFAINDKVGNPMEKSVMNMMMFAGIFTLIAISSPGLVVNGLTKAGEAAWTYIHGKMRPARTEEHPLADMGPTRAPETSAA